MLECDSKHNENCKSCGIYPMVAPSHSENKNETKEIYSSTWPFYQVCKTMYLLLYMSVFNPLDYKSLLASDLYFMKLESWIWCLMLELPILIHLLPVVVSACPAPKLNQTNAQQCNDELSGVSSFCSFIMAVAIFMLVQHNNMGQVLWGQRICLFTRQRVLQITFIQKKTIKNW